MSNQYLKLRRSAVPGRIPSTSSIEFGEIALNTYDGKAFIKKSGSFGEEVIALGTGLFSGSNFFIPVFSGSDAIVSSTIYQSSSFTAIGYSGLPEDPANPDMLYINGSQVDTYNLITADGDQDEYVQISIQNYNTGSNASTDIVASADNSTENSNYISLGVNSSTYNNPTHIGVANDAYVYSTGNDLYIGNGSIGQQLILFNGGLDAINKARVWINDQGTVAINSDQFSIANPPALHIQGVSVETHNLITAIAEINDYSQLNLTNRSTGEAASSDIVATNNLESESEGYINMGINSTNYSTPDFVGGPGDGYLYSTGNHLHIGNASPNQPVMFFAGGLNADIHQKLILYPNNKHEMTGSLTVSSGITGSLYGTASWAISASWAPIQTNVDTASFISSSNVYGPYGFDSIKTSSFALTASSADTFTVRQSLTAPSITASLGFFGDGSQLTNVGYVEKVYYVAEDGLDTNDGKTLSTPFRTIKAAIAAASASRSNNPAIPAYRQSVHVKTGYYVEDAPITVPPNTSILGDDLRTVVIRPSTATSGSNLFLMNNGTFCWGLRLEGCTIDNLEDPRNGFFFAFAPGAYIVTSPYVQNCSAIHTPFDKFYAPLDSGSNPPNPLVGNGPGGMIVDDSVLDGYSPLRSMIVDSYTQVAFNGIGLCARGSGYAQMVSFFTNFSRVGTYCIEGGHASLLNSNTTFGDYGLRSKGVRMLVKPNISIISSSIDVDGALIIRSEKDSIRNYMITKLQQSGSYNTSYLPSGSRYEATLKDSGLLIDAISDDLFVPVCARTSQFGSGLFKGQDVSSGSIYTLPIATGSNFTEGAITVFPLISNSSGSLAGDFIKSYQYIKEYILVDPDNKFSGVTLAGKNKVGQMLDVIIDVVQRVVVDEAGADLLIEFGSLITSTSHDFSYAGAGVNFLALPINQGGVGETNVDLRISQENGGRVYYTAGDETGDFFAGNDFVIRQATGNIEGRTFYKSVTAQVTPINLALETN